jgi:hypothetical protein
MCRQNVIVLNVKLGGTLDCFKSACYCVTAYYYEIQKRPVDEDLTDLDGFSRNTPVSCLLSPTDTEQTKPVITAVTLNKTIKLLRIRPCMFKNVN